ncbi:hypothetical protein J19TS2_24280 [Cohnella xylanilytica]|uniref:DUF4097 family beta strand repeat protein n=1 Tax=Cohnella xylanilytica TaxID=557555 RepID=A0A841TX09_9BACL|nr:DUF4097 family beta strand repeat-containing protein [Cohnella xylanilytica]MBB6691562.1 DUF4097 family beta strand repeat protein [Cohnella xylanilytica]GIO12873.1 hypothetical protein J19TS2_24280 [Cohnella xylanilytica]
MAKRWISVAAGLILVGIGGAALYGFNFGKPLNEYHHKWEFRSGDLKELSIAFDSQASTIEFQPSADGKNSVLIEGKAKQEIIDRIGNVRVSGGALKIDMKERFRWFNFNFGPFVNDKQHVVVTLTEEAAAALDTLRFSTDAGSMTVNGAEARAADFSTDAGSIRVDGFEGETLKLHTDAGRIAGTDIRADLNAKTDAGSIDIQHLTGTAKLSTDSGSVKLLKDDTTGADIKTDAGSVRVQIPESYEGTFDLKTDAGSVTAPDAKGTSPEVIKVRTDAGSIRVSYTE